MGEGEKQPSFKYSADFIITAWCLVFVLLWDVAETQSWFTHELILVSYSSFHYQKKSSSSLSAIHQIFLGGDIKS